MTTGHEVLAVVAVLHTELRRWPTVEEFAARYGVQPTAELEIHLLGMQRTMDILVRSIERRDDLGRPFIGEEPPEQDPDDPFVCDLCGQLLEPTQRCNSGIHEGPDVPSNLFRGHPVRLSRSRFDRVTPTPPG